MIVEHDLDCGLLYEQQRQELLAVARGLTTAQLHVFVPATPEWTVLDVLAHVTGIAHDLNRADFGPGDGDAWTAAQVASRRGRPLQALAAEWDAEAPLFEDGLGMFGYSVGAHFVGDLVQHLADVRHALGLSRIVDGDAVTASLDFYIDSFHGTLVDQAIGSVRVRAGDDECVTGAGPVVATVAADRYELLRSLGGRRTAEQVRSLGWSGDVDAVLPHVSRYGLPAAPLVGD